MNILEATKAMKEGKWIRREREVNEYLCIAPHLSKAYLKMENEGRPYSECNLTREEIEATDWVVLEGVAKRREK